MVTQSIIVYRNPMEAAFWESGLVFPVIVGMVTAVIVALIIAQILNVSTRMRRRGFLWENQGNITVGSAILTMVATIYLMASQ
jgi:hypothetical protein